MSSVSDSALFCVGGFSNFTLGFRDKFDSHNSNWLIEKIKESFIQPQKYRSLGDFSPSPQATQTFIMNTFWVPEGSVEIVSKTNRVKMTSSKAIWELSVSHSDKQCATTLYKTDTSLKTAAASESTNSFSGCCEDVS